jgi:PLP dependent protein
MEITEETFQQNLDEVRARIRHATLSAGRAVGSVSLLPVTKTHPEQVVSWVERAGLGAVGENRVQEALAKKNETPAQVRWELIGPLQRNKAKTAVGLFDRIQSVDRPSLIDVLERCCTASGRAPLAILLQVNAGRDPAKSGVAPEDAGDLLEKALATHCLRVEGLMTIAPLSEDPSVAREAFKVLSQVRDDLQKRLGHPLPELSMGMSDDLDAAIAEGSTLVRVGSALFGKRAVGKI